MDAGIKISVLMSVYNPQDHDQLSQAVQSILTQTFHDWEMILYDDGSDEEYIDEIIEEASRDERIRYIRGESNKGLAYAMNVCLTFARGDYIARMDADDISKPERLQKMYEFLEENKDYDWVGCNTELIDDNGVWGTRTMPEIPEKQNFLCYSPYIHPSVLFRRRVLIESGGYSISRRGEDYELFMRLHGMGRRGYNLQTPYFQYREDRDSYQRRKYRYQIEEVKIRKNGFRQLGILNYKTWPYVIKPLLIGMIPYGLLIKLKKHVRKETHVERYQGREA